MANVEAPSPALSAADEALAAFSALETKCPHISVTYSDLSLTIAVPEADQAVPSLPRTLLHLASSLLPVAQKTVKVHALKSLHGTIPHSKSTLILGAPGSGKSVLLRVLAGRLAPDAGSNLRFSGATPGELTAAGVSLTKLAAYAPQADTHEALLTVRETFSFMHAVALPQPTAVTSPDAKAAHAAKVPALIKSLGLAECENTFIGSAAVRGVSGGQRKRVTVGEALLSGARLVCLDEVTNGLDSSTAEDLCRFLQKWAHKCGGTVIAALQAPSPEILAAFDEVILLSAGQVLFHGPTNGLAPHLSTIGFAPPKSTDLADFAVELAASPAMTQELHGAEMGSPLSTHVHALAAHWNGLAKGGKAETAGAAADGAALIASIRADPAATSQYASPFANPLLVLLWLLLLRQLALTRRNLAFVMAKLNQSIVMGLVIGSLYYQGASTTNFVTKISLAQYAAVFVSFTSMAELPVAFASKRVVSRHLESHNYPALAYLASVLLVHLPVAMLGDLFFALPLYYLSGFSNDLSGARFAFFWWTILNHDLAMSTIFRALAFLCPSPELAQAAAGASTGVLLVLGGFLISYNVLPDYCWPIYWFSPFSWSVRSLSNNEFNAPVYNQPVGGPGSPTMEEAYTSAFGLNSSWSYTLAGPFVLIAYYLIFGLLLSALILTYVRAGAPPGTRRSSEEAEASDLAAMVTRRTVASTAASSRESTDSGEPTTPSPVATPVVDASAVAITVPAALPFSAVTFAWENITYSVPVVNPKTKAKSSLQLLRGISGVARPGTLTALMGASGAGKTTLLDVIAQRKTYGVIGGKTTVNGVPTTAQSLAVVSGYCEQDDTHLPTATVREALEFSAGLRLASSVTPAQRAQHVDSVLQLLELHRVAGRVVDSLSPSEMKRLTIGVELAANPALVLLDEPTTGLDSRSAAVVVKALKRIAATGRTVIATVHQPSASLFRQFSDLLLLAPGGYPVFAGPVGRMVSYFESQGVRPLPPFTNAASWMVSVVAESAEQDAAAAADSAAPAPEAPKADPSSPAAPAGRKPPRLALAFQASQLAADNEAAVTAAVAGEGKAAQAAGGHRGASPLAQFCVIAARSLLDSWRHRTYNPVRVGVYAFLSLFFGLLYNGIAYNKADQAHVLSGVAVILMSSSFFGLIFLVTGIPGLFDTRAVFYRERAAHFYSPTVYGLAVGVTEIPWAFFLSLGFVSITYFMFGFLPTASAFFTYWLATFLLGIYYAAIALMFSALLPSAQLAAILSGITTSLTILFGGVFLTPSEMGGWSWLYYAVANSHALRLQALPQYYCNVGVDSCPLMSLNGGGSTEPAYSYVVSRLSSVFEDRWREVGWILFIITCLRIVGVWATQRFVHVRR